MKAKFLKGNPKEVNEKTRNGASAKSEALKKLKLGEGSLAERRESASKANTKMRKRGTFYIKENESLYKHK